MRIREGIPMKHKYQTSRLISILYRQGCRFFDRELSGTMVGYGQQLFLILIYENQGISVLDLAKMGQFDKGTVTKAIQKLEEQRLIRWEPDAKDRRIHHVFTTDEAEPIIEEVYRKRHKWNSILVRNMSKEEAAAVDKLLSRMTENAFDYINHGKQDESTLTSTSESDIL